MINDQWISQVKEGMGFAFEISATLAGIVGSPTRDIGVGPTTPSGKMLVEFTNRFNQIPSEYHFTEQQVNMWNGLVTAMQSWKVNKRDYAKAKKEIENLGSGIMLTGVGKAILEGKRPFALQALAVINEHFFEASLEDFPISPLTGFPALFTAIMERTFGGEITALVSSGPPATGAGEGGNAAPEGTGEKQFPWWIVILAGVLGG